MSTPTENAASDADPSGTGTAEHSENSGHSEIANDLAGEVALFTGGGSDSGWGCAHELAQKGATVVLAGLTHRYMTAYAVSKAGLDMLIRQTADEMGPVGIRANSVRPGLVPTDATTLLMSVPTIHEDYLAQMPLGQVGSPTEVAGLVGFLASPHSAWITGACIPIDGGHHLRRGPDLSAVMPAFGSPLIR